jgi:hypothetical protein
LSRYRDGGFTSTEGERPSLNATFFGLRSLKRLQPGWVYRRFVRREAERIRGFVESCVSASGGAAFAADLSRYAENCLATRYAVLILDALGPGRVAPTAGPIEKFLTVQQYNDQTGGFRGYLDERVEAAQPAVVSRYLAKKNERLLAAVPPHWQPAEIPSWLRYLKARSTTTFAGYSRLDPAELVRSKQVQQFYAQLKP